MHQKCRILHSICTRRYSNHSMCCVKSEGCTKHLTYILQVTTIKQCLQLQVPMFHVEESLVPILLNIWVGELQFEHFSAIVADHMMWLFMTFLD